MVDIHHVIDYTDHQSGARARQLNKLVTGRGSLAVVQDASRSFKGTLILPALKAGETALRTIASRGRFAMEEWMTDETPPKRYRKPGPVAVAAAALREAKREDSLGRSPALGLAFKAIIGMTGLSYQEAADVLGLTLNQIKARSTGRQAIARSEIIALLDIHRVVENPTAENMEDLPSGAKDRAAGAWVIRKFRDGDPSFPLVDLPEFLRPDPSGETD